MHFVTVYFQEFMFTLNIEKKTDNGQKENKIENGLYHSVMWAARSNFPMYLHILNEYTLGNRPTWILVSKDV